MKNSIKRDLIAFIKIDAQQFAPFKFRIDESGGVDFGIAQIAGFKGTTLEPGLPQYRIIEAAVDEPASKKIFIRKGPIREINFLEKFSVPSIFIKNIH